jgi:hypothetical protein
MNRREIIVGLAGGFGAPLGMHGGTNPLARALGKGIWQIYRLARPDSNGQTAVGGGPV